MNLSNKNRFKLAGIILLMSFICLKTNGESLIPIIPQDSLAIVLRQLEIEKPNIKKVNTLIKLARFYLYYSQPKGQEYADKAMALSKTLGYEAGLVEAMNIKAAFVQYHDNNKALSQKLLNDAILLSKKHALNDLEAYSVYTKGVMSLKSQPDTAISYFQKAANLYKKLGYKSYEAFMIKSIAEIHVEQNKYAEALNELKQAITIYKRAGYPKLHYTYKVTHDVYKSMSNYEEALKYALLTIKSAEATKDTADIIRYYSNTAQLLTQLNHQSQALTYWQYVLDNLKDHYFDFYFHRNAAVSIASILIKMRKRQEAIASYKKAMSQYLPKPGTIEYSTDLHYLGDLYFKTRQFDKARPYFTQMLNYKGPQNETFNLLCYKKLAHYYVMTREFDKAKIYVDKADASKVRKSKIDRVDIHYLQFKVDSASKNYLSAIKHYKQHKLINDSVYNERRSQQIATITVQHETEKKIDEINNLTARNNHQKIVVEKREFERNVFTAGSVMLSLLLLISISRYRIKQRTNKQLQEQQDTINKKNEILNCLLNEKEELLASKDKLITEKEWLIKEVHHRVKNNLQMISTLLYSQSTYLKDQVAIAAINESQQRIHAISLIHQKLYQSDNLQMVNIKSYILELVDYLQESFDAAHDVEFNVVVDALEMDVTKAIPLGIIINEAITNSLKYAFTEDQRKIISIQLRHNGDNCALLIIKDNGIGMPADFDPQESDSLGINLMQGLSHQINADLIIKNDDGTEISLNFKKINEALPEELT